MSEAKLLAKEPTASKSPASKGQRRKVPFKELIHQRQFKRRAFVASILIPLLVWFFIFMFLPIVMVVIYDAAFFTGFTSSINLITSLAGGAIFLVFLLRYRRQSNADWA